jgi:hypothetical protein
MRFQGFRKRHRDGDGAAAAARKTGSGEVEVEDLQNWHLDIYVSNMEIING